LANQGINFKMPTTPTVYTITQLNGQSTVLPPVHIIHENYNELWGQVLQYGANSFDIDPRKITDITYNIFDSVTPDNYEIIKHRAPFNVFADLRLHFDVEP